MNKKKHNTEILCLIIFLFFLNCGKKGPLQLTPKKLPKAVEKFKITQIGKSIKLKWNFPEYLSDKKARLEISKIKYIFIHYSEKNIPFHKFKSKSILLLKLKLKQISKKANTAFKEIKFKVKELNNKKYYFSIRYQYERKKSPMSKVVSIRTAIPAKKITDLKINKESKIIKLNWSKPIVNLANFMVKNIAGYKIYKKIEDEKHSEEMNEFKRVNEERVVYEYYEDKDTSRNGNYSYYISTIISNQIESEPSNTVVVNVTDIYPPDIPSNLASFTTKDHIYLTWRKVEDNDLSHYRIYRKSESDEEFKLIADNIMNNYYSDKSIQEGQKYYYYITSVDLIKNESEKSNIAKSKFEK